MQSVLSRIWTRIAVSISCDDNHYTTGTSTFFFLTYCSRNVQSNLSNVCSRKVWLNVPWAIGLNVSHNILKEVYVSSQDSWWVLVVVPELSTKHVGTRIGEQVLFTCWSFWCHQQKRERGEIGISGRGWERLLYLFLEGHFLASVSLGGSENSVIKII